MAPLTPDRRKYWLLGLPVFAAMIWISLARTDQPHQWRQALHEFRGDASPDPGPNRPMADALQTRQFLLRSPHSKLTLTQSNLLTGLINSPVNDLSQSEALDVLNMAQRANALSPGQVRDAQEATFAVLNQSPGPMVRLESARFLGHLGNKGARDGRGKAALTLLEGDTDPKIRQAAHLALARMQK